MKIDQKVQDTEDIGDYDDGWYMVRERRLVALEAVANAARVLVSVNEGFMDTVWQAEQWGPLEKALEELDKESSCQ